MSILRPSEQILHADVVVVGGGLAGTLSAILLSRQGWRVALIDPHPVYPPDFRAEQLVGAQVTVLRRLGLLDILVRDSVPATQAVAMRGGRLIGCEAAPHYGIHYDVMVNRARTALPASTQVITGKVSDIQFGRERQNVWLCDGRLVQGRLVVLATGLGRRLTHRLNIERAVLRENQSLTFGFDVEVGAPALFRSSVLVVYGEQQGGGGTDYLTIFAIENKLRANLFTYHDRRDPWVRQFMQQPREMLRQVMPHLQQILHGYRLAGTVQMRVNDLTVVTEPYCHGLVLIGDTFQTSCPAAGTGIGRILNDIDRLCRVHMPRWFNTPGMEYDKIEQFYDDPVKRACDAEALHIANYRRSFVTETGLSWGLHRRRVALQRRLQLSLQRWTRERPRLPDLAGDRSEADKPLVFEAPSLDPRRRMPVA